MRIVSGQQICGVDALSLRHAFRQLRSFDSFSAELIAEKLDCSSAHARAVTRALATDGYITLEMPSGTNPSWRLTSKARTLALASAANPLTRPTADRLVQGFLARAMAVNANAELSFVVSDAVLFGSYLTTAQRINDIDIGFRLAGRMAGSDPREDVERRVSAARTGGRTFRSWFDELCWPRTEVLLSLKSRSRGISLHDMDDDAIFTDSLRVRTIMKNCQCV
jgi:hypothetical protein